MPYEKEFGKLSLAQIKELVETLQHIRKERKEFIRLAKEDKNEFLENAPPEFSWSSLYSIPLAELLSFFLVAGGLSEEVVIASESGDPQQYILDRLPHLEIKLSDYGGGEESSKYLFTALLMAISTSLEAIEVYGCSMNTLHYRFRAGDENALFGKRQRIDTCYLQPHHDRLTPPQPNGGVPHEPPRQPAAILATADHCLAGFGAIRSGLL